MWSLSGTLPEINLLLYDPRKLLKSKTIVRQKYQSANQKRRISSASLSQGVRLVYCSWIDPQPLYVWPLYRRKVSGKCSHKSLPLTVTTRLDVEKAHCELHPSKESLSSHHSWTILSSWCVMANQLVVNKYSFIRDGFSNFQLVQLPVERTNTFVLTHPRSIFLSKKPPVIMTTTIHNEKDDEGWIFWYSCVNIWRWHRLSLKLHRAPC